MSEELIIKEIEDNKEEYIEFLRELIKTESYNPPGNEKNVALKIEQYLKDVDVKCEIFSFGDNRANLIAYLNDNFKGKNLLYNGHMDVVPPGSETDWKNPPLSATVKRNKFVYGRGSSDMKGGLAAMTIALKILNKLNIKLSGNLILNAVADEETGGKLGTGWLLENRMKSIKCDFSIVGELTNFKPLSQAILLGEKGRIQLKIVANGISGHASVPFMGKNAINMMSDIIQSLDNLYERIPKINPPIPLNKLKKLVSDSFPNEEAFERVYREQPKLSNTLIALTQFTHSVTMINAGIKENVIPDRCEAKVDFRVIPGQPPEIIISEVKKLIKELGYQIKDDPIGAPREIFVYLEVEGFSEASYWENWETSQELREFFDVVEKSYKKKPFYFLMPGSADAKFLRNSGYCPQTIIFGPGVLSTAHSVDEYIEIQDFLNAIKVYALFAYRFLK